MIIEKQKTNFNMIDWWKKVVFNNYANFNGRARRAEYWHFTLFNTLLILFVAIVFGAITYLTGWEAFGYIGMALYMLMALGTLIPSLAVLVRRLHDLNKSGTYAFIYLIPLVGPIIVLVWLFTDGNRTINKYGPDPKRLNEADFDFDQQKPFNIDTPL